MAGMKRFVTYIYSYENKEKGRNIGFARIEIRGEECRVELHLRGAYARQVKCAIYLFREAEGAIEGICIGEMKLLNGKGDFFTALKSAHIRESTLSINDMEGIFMLGEDEQIYMSRWREGNPIEVCAENFKIWESESEEVQETEKTEPEADVQTTEIPMRNVFPDYEWDKVWEGLVLNHAQYHPFADREAECVQIELRHLRELPRRYWYLGNNSFLLHGFFNYQYLVVGKTGEGRWFIGVPGVYQRQECVMAVIFGFPDFMVMAFDGGENEKSNEPLNRFGCWIRYVDE